MFFMLNTMFFLFFLINLMLILNLMIMKKVNLSREKLTPIECGFNMMSYFNLPFSIQFYFISILFIIFDIEIILLIPMIQKNLSIIINKLMIFLFVILILILGFYLEWWNNMINWF
uniref:NADH-ubiquinone oxidoreductase chain 3 n=1 Tax=Scelio sp. ZJUH_2016028 TaxID=2496283 RepID=A0A3S8V171_9HYME|nr:NADH dehydrogenase subunit 3 [Scelio sp. ZJUH_2016028]